MTERKVPTLADAQRQVWLRGSIGGSLIGLALVIVFVAAVKHLYLNPSNPFNILGENGRRLIYSILQDWFILNLLWRVIPPWQPRISPTTAEWEIMYAFWVAIGVTVVGILLCRSASICQAQIRQYRQEIELEEWKEQARAARGVAPGDRGSTTVIGQAVWYEYPAPPESWSQTLSGILILGLIVAVVSGLIILYAEYSFFQAHWPSSRN